MVTRMAPIGYVCRARSLLSQCDLSAAKVIHAPDDLERPRGDPLGEYRLRPLEQFHALIDVRANGVVQEIAALGLGSLHRWRNGVHQYAHVPFRLGMMGHHVARSRHGSALFVTEDHDELDMQ